MSRAHDYHLTLNWTGAAQGTTSDYGAYSRQWQATMDGKPALDGSSDPLFKGDPALYNPEDLLLASLSSCHMLWYLHLCAENNIHVLSYSDQAVGTMNFDGGDGQFVEAILRPTIEIGPGGDADLAERLHDVAHEKCFIARSINFPVRCEPIIRGEGLSS